MAKKTLKQRKREALERAVKAAGSGVKLARKLGKDETIVATWRQRGQVSYIEALQVEALTGVPAYELRPDVYRKPLIAA